MLYEIYFEEKSFKISGREDDPITKFHLAQKQFYELEDLTFLKTIISRYKSKHISIVDAGANIGNHSVFFANAFPDATVYSFEMNPETYMHLTRTVHENELTNILTINLGLSDKIGQCGVKANMLNPLGGAQLDLCMKNGHVNLTTIDNYFKDININSDISLFKIDVEGHELNVLKGSLNTLNKYKPLIFLECKEISEFDEILKVIEPLDYEVVLAGHGQLPNFLFVHRQNKEIYFSYDEIYSFNRDLCYRHVQSWQLVREVKQLTTKLNSSIK